MIDNALKDLDFKEEEVLFNFDPKSKKQIEVKEPIVNKFLSEFGWSYQEYVTEEVRVDGVLQLDDEGNPKEEVIEIKNIYLEKHAVINNLKLHLDLDKANRLVLRVKEYKHNKKKGELEHKLKDLVQNNVYFLEAFGDKIIEVKGERMEVNRFERMSEWDKDDLIDFEAKVLKLEEAKVKLDEKEKKEKPIKDRQREYSRIDDLLFEALVEKLEEGRPEKMEKYLKLRKEIKDKHPLED